MPGPLLGTIYLLPVIATCVLGMSMGQDSAIVASVLALGGAVVCMVLLSRPFAGSILAHLTLGLLIYLYYGKLIFLWYFPEAGYLALLGWRADYAVDPRVWSEAFLASSVAVSAVAVGIPAGVILSPFVPRTAEDREQRFLRQVRALRDAHKVGFWLSAGLVVVVLAEVGLWHFGIGTMGQTQVQLPGKLSALIYYSHKAVVPAIGLLFLCFGRARGERTLLVIGVAVLLGYAATEVLSRASRGAFLTSGLWIAFFIYVTSKQGGRLALKAFSVFAAVGFLAYPIVTAYRFARESGLPLGDVVSNWSRGMFLYVFAALKIFFRLLGSEHLIFVVGSDLGSVGLFPEGMRLTDYYTVAAGYEEDSEMAATPGLVGSLYMIGGLPVVWLGIFAFSTLSLVLFRLGELPRFRAGRIFQVIIGARFVQSMFGGMTPRHVLDFGAIFLALAVMEILLRTRLTPPPATETPDPTGHLHVKAAS